MVALNRLKGLSQEDEFHFVKCLTHSFWGQLMAKENCWFQTKSLGEINVFLIRFTIKGS